MSDLAALAESLGLPPEGVLELRKAFTHRSCGSDNGEAVECNERMEFLGDSILGLVVCEHLYERFPEWSEGQLAKTKALMVSEPILAEAARAMGLGEWLQMGRGEEVSGGRERASILSDTFEAVVAAVFRTAGLEAVRRFVLPRLELSLQEVIENRIIRDYKSALQERYQEEFKVTPAYSTVGAEGSDHNKTFIAQVKAGRKILGRGAGRSKKEAEQDAAREALARIQWPRSAAQPEDGRAASDESPEGGTTP
ncbi:MAG: ribonuclease III [Armatimonadetes bacterium]|nr:ribonuclease III [Armatimonadota bacterium]